MVRVHTYTRDLNTIAEDRSRVASMIDRAPVTVAVSRYAVGSGVTSPKNTLTPVGSFKGRLEEMRRMPQTVTNDAYSITPITLLLICLRNNDAVDGVSGSAVNIAKNDRVTITDENTTLGTFVVASINPTRSHYEIALQERA